MKVQDIDVQDIAGRTAGEIAFAYRTGAASPIEITEYLLDRIAQAKDDNVFLAVTTERARSEARRAHARYEAGRPLSALDGVPIAWKDNFDIAGTPTTAASLLFKDAAPKQSDVPCAANAAAAGMVCLGKLNMTEFAYSVLGLNPHYGTPVNPHDRVVHRSPGGSSSGCGAAVAAGLVPYGIGSDTGGSVRVPASFNGVVGFKTSEGRIDKSGVFALSRTLDTVGPLARSVTDCILIDTVLRGRIALDEVRRADLHALRIIAPTNVVLDDVETAVRDNYERTLEALERAGATVERRPVDTLEEVVEVTARYGTLTAAEAYNEYRDIIDSDAAKKVDRRVVSRILAGKRMSASDLLSIQWERQRLIAKLRAQLGDGLLAMPTTPLTAPPIAPLESDDDTFYAVNLRTLRNTVLGNILDLCGLALPNGRDAAGLPTSILFSGCHGAEAALLGYGLEIERVIDEAWSGSGPDMRHIMAAGIAAPAHPARLGQ
jgi:aspartyl-tRNA(Asn)/glutamyl-tRNA(Gln) amidotransferase subunit A